MPILARLLLDPDKSDLFNILLHSKFKPEIVAHHCDAASNILKSLIMSNSRKNLAQGASVPELLQEQFIMLLHSKFKPEAEAHHCDAPNNITKLHECSETKEAQPSSKTLIDIREILKMHRNL